MKPPEKYRRTTDRYRDVDLITLAKARARLSLEIRERMGAVMRALTLCGIAFNCAR